jgi:DNA-binding Lrp family transcriptional regulator
MAQAPPPRWTFLTNHAQVLICIAEEPGMRLRDISERIGITERAAHRIVTELAQAGYITRNRTGRRNAYLVHTDLPLPDALTRNQRVGDLLTILTAARPVDTSQ